MHAGTGNLTLLWNKTLKRVKDGCGDTCLSSLYLGGEGRRSTSLRPAWTYLARPCLNKQPNKVKEKYLLSEVTIWKQFKVLLLQRANILHQRKKVNYNTGLYPKKKDTGNGTIRPQKGYFRWTQELQSWETDTEIVHKTIRIDLSLPLATTLTFKIIKNKV